MRTVTVVELLRRRGRFKGWTVVSRDPARDVYRIKGPSRFYRRRPRRMAGK